MAQQRSRLWRCVWCIWEGANDQRVTASAQTHTKCLQYGVTAQFKQLWKLRRQTIDVWCISCVLVQLRNVTVCSLAKLGRFVSLFLIFIGWNNKEKRPETETHAHSDESITVLLLEEQNVQLYLSLCCYLVHIYTILSFTFASLSLLTSYLGFMLLRFSFLGFVVVGNIPFSSLL